MHCYLCRWVAGLPLLLFAYSRPVLALSTTASSGTAGWRPKTTVEERKKLRGIRHASELIGTAGFHHVEFYCGDAKGTASRFALALGLSMTGSTGQHTGNDQCISFGLESGNVRFLLTAPYSRAVIAGGASSSAASPSAESKTTAAHGGSISPLETAPNPLPKFSLHHAHEFFAKHGVAVRAVAVEVKDSAVAFANAVANGATPVLEPTFLPTCPGQQAMMGQSVNDADSGCYLAEVELYGDVVLRFVSFPNNNPMGRGSDGVTGDHVALLPFLPHLAPLEGKMARRRSYGLYRIDHAVGNVHNLLEALTRISAYTGFHEFAEFTHDDVGTVESGLNSVVLASDSEDVLLPLNEPTHGRRKSQIQTFLEQNEGPGLQHLALKTKDIFHTIELIRKAEDDLVGFELMRRPSDQYYRELPSRLGEKLTAEQYRRLEELGILADADDEGILLQIFTKPISDRPTFFFEIIQRIGCEYRPAGSEVEVERPGCGGFGHGNFRELFKSIEDYEKNLKV